jgi:hypothetical protein
MSNDLTTSKTFQERMYERVRDSIGDLMTDEDLKKIVEAGLQKAFFEGKERTEYGRVIAIEPPLIVGIVKELLGDKVKEEVKAYLQANPDVIQKAIHEAIAKGFFELVVSYFENKVEQSMYDFSNQLARNLQNQ